MSTVEKRPTNYHCPDCDKQTVRHHVALVHVEEEPMPIERTVGYACTSCGWQGDSIPPVARPQHP